MQKKKIKLELLEKNDREQFIIDNQISFKYGALVEFGKRDDHLDDDGEIISRETIEKCIDDPDNVAYRIVWENIKVGGIVVKIDNKTHYNYLKLFFISSNYHNKGIGFAAWKALEEMYPETKVWETCTPYFEKRNIHFYVNKCKFHIVEFYNEFLQDQSITEDQKELNEGPNKMFRFVKVCK